MFNGEILFAATDVARCLGYSNPQKAIRDHCKEKGVNEIDTPTNGGIQRMKYITKGNVIRLVANSTLPQAEKVESWIFDEVIPQVLDHGNYSVQKRVEPTTEEAISWITFVGKELGLNNTSKLLLMKQWGENKGLPTPDYVNSKDILLSASELLKRNNISISARVFNIAMLDKGFIEKLSRPSKKGIKYFNHLTDKASDYGENQVSPNNPKETQPLYYEHKFLELLSVIGLR